MYIKPDFTERLSQCFVAGRGHGGAWVRVLERVCETELLWAEVPGGGFVV